MTNEQTQTRQHWGNTSFGTGMGVGAAFAGILGGFGLLALGAGMGTKQETKIEYKTPTAPQIQHADLNRDGTNEAFYTINGQVATVAPEYNSRQR